MFCGDCNGTGIISYFTNEENYFKVVCSYCKGEGVVNMGKVEDKVNHPKHYTYGKYEVIDVLEDWGLDKEFCLGNTVKYIARAKHKGNELEDLRKAQWYLNRKIKQLSDEVISGKEK